MSEDKLKKEEENIRVEKEQTCIGVTASGDSCKNNPTFPEDKPLYCHHHKHQFSEDDYKTSSEDSIREINETPVGSRKHVFASQHLTHTIFIDCPEFAPERGFIRIKFVEGRYETDDDKKAELIQKSIKNNRNLQRKITKVQ